MKDILNATKQPRDSSFLPEDYIARKNEVRINTLGLLLFVIVTVGVLFAFFITARQWNDVKRYQQVINVQYTQAAKDIEQLKVLEGQKTELLGKAELTTALIERVPRSILLAELINRMPQRMTMLTLEVKSTRLDKQARRKSRVGSAPAVVEPKAPAGTSMSRRARGSPAAKPAEEESKPEFLAPRFETKVILIGVAPTHQDVARYVAALHQCALLSDIELIFSENTVLLEREMSKFRIEMMLRQDADARDFQPLEAPRTIEFTSPGDLRTPDQARRERENESARARERASKARIPTVVDQEGR